MKNELFLLSNNVSINFMYFEDSYDVICNDCSEDSVVKYIENNKDFISNVTVNGNVSEKLKDFIVNNVKDYDFN